jgi:hypothetical protein
LCSSSRVPKPIDRTGTRYGRLVVTERAGDYKPARWTCVCDCGATVVAVGANLVRGCTSSCGCLRKEASAARRTTHGATYTPEFVAWVSMRTRCNCTTNPRYGDYGGRGITVSAPWAASFDTFLSDMGPRPSASHSLDRIDNDGPYAADNCRWATTKQQGANRRPWGAGTRSRWQRKDVSLTTSATVLL